MDVRMSNIASPMPQIRAKFTNKLGIPLSGCKVYTYEPNSDIPKTTWLDTDKAVENTNPILLDSAGEADIFLDGLYRVVVKDRFGFVVYDVEKTGNPAQWDASFVVDASGKSQQYINNEFAKVKNLYIFIDDVVSHTDGSVSVSNEINAAIRMYGSFNVTFIGNTSSSYRFDSTIDLIGMSGITLDFCGATIIDNVQGYIPDSGNRGAHTFVIHDAEDITVKRFNYTCLPTRANSIATTNIPANVFWVGGQYLGGAMTSNIKIHDLKFESGGFDQGFIVCALGELDGLDVRRISVKGGSWGCGINAEYGLRPVDLEEDATLTNGRHPYNIYVEEFKGENLPNCRWFLRVASCYNIKFFNCTGFNVPNFIYYYSGDRGISRYNQNVSFENCKAKFDNSVTTAQHCVQIIVTTKDGSTGEILPVWTNRHHQIKFTMCEFIGNYTPQMTAVRFYGCLGKVTFDNCVFKRFHIGVHAQYTPTTNPNVPSPFVLSFRDCLFIKNNKDVLQVDTAGVLYDHCTFKNRVVGNGEGYQIDVLIVNGNCAGTSFRNCNVSDQPVSATPMRVTSKGVYLDSNNFDLFDTSTVALTSSEVIRGTNNQTNGKLTGDGESDIRVIGDKPKVKVFSNANLGNSLNYDSAGVWLIRTTRTIEKILGGDIGDVVDIRAEVTAADVTFTYNSPNATNSTRLLNKSNVTDSVTGSSVSRKYMKFADGWREM